MVLVLDFCIFGIFVFFGLVWIGIGWNRWYSWNRDYFSKFLLFIKNSINWTVNFCWCIESKQYNVIYFIDLLELDTILFPWGSTKNDTFSQSSNPTIFCNVKTGYGNMCYLKRLSAHGRPLFHCVQAADGVFKRTTYPSFWYQ